MWADHIDPPGDTDSCGQHRRRLRDGERSEYGYDESLPASYTDPTARVAWLDQAGLDETVLFPNYGLLWERRLSSNLPALTANMTAWNRWCASVRQEGGGRLHPVGHVTLRDPAWLTEELSQLSAAGVRLAMVAPAPIDGRPMSHPDHDRLWSAFVDHGITPVFHVADQPRVLDDCWYTDTTAFVPVIESVFLWVPPALALTDLILNGVFDRHPGLRVGGRLHHQAQRPAISRARDATQSVPARPRAHLLVLLRRPATTDGQDRRCLHGL